MHDRHDKDNCRDDVWKVEFYLEVLQEEFYISVLHLTFNIEKHDSLLSTEECHTLHVTQTNAN